VLWAERDWSQAELADLLNVSRQTVIALETGKYDSSLPLAFKLAGLFACRIEDIFKPDEGKKRCNNFGRSRKRSTTSLQLPQDCAIVWQKSD